MLNWLKSAKIPATPQQIRDGENSTYRGESGAISTHQEEIAREMIVTDEEEGNQPSKGNQAEENKREERTSQRKRSADDENQPGRKKRKYDEHYLGLGFSFIGDNDCPKPQCVVCGDVLANSCMKPSYLRRHLHTKHPHVSERPLDFLSRNWTN